MKGKIKKIISLLLMAVMLFGCFGITGCSFEDKFESDGKFKYYYDESRDSYAIVGTEPDGYGDPMYIPAYYKGKVIYTGGIQKSSYIGGLTSYSIDLGNAKKIYCPFGYAKPIFFTSSKEFYIISVKSTANYGSLNVLLDKDIVLTTTYLTEECFKQVIKEFIERDQQYLTENHQHFYEYEIEDGIFKVRVFNHDVNMATLKIANTSYHFNFDNSPNEDYFFINDFEDGQLIENTPYEPLREGYIFDGWYKEPECINKCNFGVDTYIEQYDENGELIFNELKLYAKWIEK